MVNVGKYTSPMDAMGIGSSSCLVDIGWMKYDSWTKNSSLTNFNHFTKVLLLMATRNLAVTSWYGKYITGLSCTMPGGCLGFQPSTVCKVRGFFKVDSIERKSTQQSVPLSVSPEFSAKNIRMPMEMDYLLLFFFGTWIFMETQHDFGAVSPESSVNICLFQSLCFNPPAVALQRRGIVFCDRKKTRWPQDSTESPFDRTCQSLSPRIVRLELELNHTHPKQSKDDMDLPAGHWSIHFRWEQTWSKYDGNLRRIYAYNSA